MLEALVQEEFQIRHSGGTVRSLLMRLFRSHEVLVLQQAHDAGTCGAEEIKGFVDRLLAAHPGPARFPFEVTLAAVAVALRGNYSRFAQEFIGDLARLSNPRFAMARGVAMGVLALRELQSTTSLRTFDFGFAGSANTDPQLIELHSTTTPHCRETLSLSGTAA